MDKGCPVGQPLQQPTIDDITITKCFRITTLKSLILRTCILLKPRFYIFVRLCSYQLCSIYERYMLGVFPTYILLLLYTSDVCHCIAMLRPRCKRKETVWNTIFMVYRKALSTALLYTVKKRVCWHIPPKGHSFILP